MAKINGPFHSLFYPDYNGDRVYSDEDFGLPFKLDHSNGVYLNQSTQALQIVAAGDMNLTVRAGYCFIEGHFGGTPQDGSITLDNADGTHPRIDRIVMRHYGSGGQLDERKLAPLVLTGTPAQNPKAPDIVRNGTYYDLSLATVLVPAGAIEITGANITDTRFDTSVCGAVTGKNENPLDTTELFAQFQAQFDQLMEQIRGTLGEDAATNLLNLYNGQTQRLTDYEGKTDGRLGVLESSSASHTSTLSSHGGSISSLNSRLNKIGTFTTILDAVSPRNGDTFTLSQSIFNFNYIVVWTSYVGIKEMRSVKAYTYIKNIDPSKLDRWFHFSITGSNYTGNPPPVESESVRIDPNDGVTVYYNVDSYKSPGWNRLIILGMN